MGPIQRLASEVAEEELRAKSVLDGKATGRASDYGLGFGEEAESEDGRSESQKETPGWYLAVGQ